MLRQVSAELEDGANVIILSDRNTSKEYAPIPALIACSYVNNGLGKLKKRSGMSLIIESAEPRDEGSKTF